MEYIFGTKKNTFLEVCLNKMKYPVELKETLISVSGANDSQVNLTSQKEPFGSALLEFTSVDKNVRSFSTYAKKY